GSIRSEGFRARRWLAGLAGVAALAFASKFLVSSPLRQVSLLTGVMAISCAVVLGTIVYGWRPVRSAWLRGVGRISYGLYLYHLPIYFALGVWPAKQEGYALLTSAAALALSFAIA